jgi:S-adenosylmethionine uptake transporter
MITEFIRRRAMYSQAINRQTLGGSTPVLAVMLMVAAALSFSLMGACVKASTGSMPFLVSLFFRSLIGVIPLGLIVLYQVGTLRSKKHWLLFQRSLLGFCAMFLFFYAIEKLPLSTAVVLNFTSPVFTVIFSALLLKEHRATRVLPLALLAFVGVFVLVGPDITSTGIEASIGLASAVLSALAYITVKKLSQTESSPLIVFYFSVWGTVFAVIVIAVAMIAGIGGIQPAMIVEHLSSPRELLLLGGVGAGGVVGQLLMTSSYARGRASMVSPFSFFNPLFSYIIGFTFFGDPLTLYSVIGGVLVVLSVVLVPVVSGYHRRTA